jgi:hypothetical protein
MGARRASVVVLADPPLSTIGFLSVPMAVDQLLPCRNICTEMGTLI